MQAEKPFYVYVHRYSSGPKEGQVFYVGKGQKQRYKSKEVRNPHWKNVVNKYGCEFEILQRFSEEKCAFTFEKIAINAYGFENLTNMTLGGEGASGCMAANRKTVYCSNGMVFNSTHEAAKWIGGKSRATAISAVCIGNQISAYGYNWSYVKRPNHPVDPEAKKPKKVYCSNGMIFDSVAHAAIWTGRLGNRINIGIAASGKRPTAYGYAWSYKNRPVAPKEVKVNSPKAIERSDGVRFKSVSEAARSISDNAQKSTISKVCYGKTKTAYGYTWKFI